ncbi:MAG TPA: glycosyltransferase [Polyangiaceae bacterium]|nr:glycosyltransferase [Polyangiaceae bacterium]
MPSLEIVDVEARSIEPLAALYGPAELSRAGAAVRELTKTLAGGAIWNVSSTARGGGVAELLHSLVAYARGAGVDCRWAVIGGGPDFFRLTKRLHNALHGVSSEPAPSEADRALYERTATEAAGALLARAQPGDVVILHDPQPLGMAPALTRRGLHVIWRCHIGSDRPDGVVRSAARFLAPYVRATHRQVFSRRAHILAQFDAHTPRVIAPSIDPLSPKNQPLTPEQQTAILVHVGLADANTAAEGAPECVLADGSRLRIQRAAEVIRLGSPAPAGEPLVVQVSRWDRLKDHIGVLHGFARYLASGGGARLILAGPNVSAVADDPEGAEAFEEVLAAYRALPHGVRRQVELATLPMADARENAAIVNALQRRATLVVQKSLQEGFGLTVAEAMWKAKPVIASRVGGIQDQIEHDVSGLLLDDPRDLQEFASLLQRGLSDPQRAERLGRAAAQRVRDEYLSLRSLYAYADLVCELGSARGGTD